MPISSSDHLFVLIQSLTKAEKRNFKLYATRTHQKEKAMFITLFDSLDSMTSYDEKALLRKIHPITKSQLPNLKRHLYNEVLSSLRMIFAHKNLDFEFRQQMDFARILYGKGLYIQSLKTLERIKGIVHNSNQNLLYYELLEFQKMIEEKHITRSRSVKNKMENLLDESEQVCQILSNSNKLTNLKIKIHGLYIQIGHIKSEKDLLIVTEYFKSHLPTHTYDSLSFFEKIYLHQSHVWYNYILLNFEKCADHSRRWIELLESDERIISNDPDLYMRGLHYWLTSLYSLDDEVQYIEGIRKFERFRDTYYNRLNKTSEVIFFLYYYSSLFYKYFLQGHYTEGLSLIPECEEMLELYDPYLDIHRVLVFYYRMAWMYFGCGDFDTAIDYLNKIINLKAGHLREDIQCYARLMHMIAHYELKNYWLLEYLEKSVSRFLDKMKDKNKVQMEVLSFMRKQLKSLDKPDYTLLLETRKNLLRISVDPFEKRSFLYLNFLDWVNAKLEEVTVEVIVRRNRERR